MSKNTKINWQGTGGEAEGHAVRPRGLDDGSQADDTEGHMPRVRGYLDDGSQTDDAEGHGRQGNGLEDGSQADDAEGHGFRFPNDDVANEDAEGHVIRPKGLDDGADEDAEGHVSLPSSAREREINIDGRIER
jgi:hypothetical protein